MKATTWLCPVLTLLCATKLVYTAQRGSYGIYPLDDISVKKLQNDFFLWKRNKPSLSIVNPLDVLRQRLLLEIARRQMKENTRQVELNREILRNVGKRSVRTRSSPLTAALYDVQRQQEQEPVQHIQPDDYELIPAALIFDYLQQQQQRQQAQRPWLPYESASIQFDNNYINDAIEESALAAPIANEDDGESGMESIEQDISAYKAAVDGDGKHSMKHIKQSNNEHSSMSPNEQREMAAAFQKSINNRNDDTKRYTLINNHQLHHHKNDLNLDLNDSKPVSSKPNANTNTNANANVNANDYKNELTDNDNVGDYQLQRYLYHLHKNQNHLTRK